METWENTRIAGYVPNLVAVAFIPICLFCPRALRFSIQILQLHKLSSYSVPGVYISSHLFKKV